MGKSIGNLAQIIEYPLTGGHGIPTEIGVLKGGGGLEHDRLFTVYDSKVDPDTEPNRVSFRQYPADFASLDLEIRGRRDFTITGGEGSLLATKLRFFGKQEEIKLNEFGEITPAYDCGDDAANFILNNIGNLGAWSLRLARKTSNWIEGRVSPAPSIRKVAPLHIVTQASVDQFNDSAVAANYDYRRFRPNLVIAGDNEPGEELSWIGRYIRIGNTIIKIQRPTVRCPVTGLDPETGEDYGDVMPLIRNAGQKVDGVKGALLGVYGSAFVKPDGHHPIIVGQSVEMYDFEAVV